MVEPRHIIGYLHIHGMGHMAEAVAALAAEGDRAKKLKAACRPLRRELVAEIDRFEGRNGRPYDSEYLFVTGASAMQFLAATADASGEENQ